jgi:hypothetical protein
VPQSRAAGEHGCENQEIGDYQQLGNRHSRNSLMKKIVERLHGMVDSFSLNHYYA